MFANRIIQRNFHLSLQCGAEASDPIQRLFVENVKIYYQKLKENNGQLFQVSQELATEHQKALRDLDKRIFKDEKIVDYTKFPEFKFQEPKLDSVNLKMPDEYALLKRKSS